MQQTEERRVGTPGIYDENTQMSSVVSAPQRGPWGDSSYRGNCDGTLIKDLVLRYGARAVADPMMGSGTCRDVVLGLNRSAERRISFWGSDLTEGFDLRRDELPGEFDFVWLHPPYWNMVRYSNDPRDLSSYANYYDFRLALEHCLVNCYRSLRPGGRLAVLVGDLRRNGSYTPIVRDVMNLEGKLGQIRSVIIKTQHNCLSNGKRYSGLEDPRIAHEYCVVFKTDQTR